MHIVIVSICEETRLRGPVYNHTTKQRLCAPSRDSRRQFVYRKRSTLSLRLSISRQRSQPRGPSRDALQRWV